MKLLLKVGFLVFALAAADTAWAAGASQYDFKAAMAFEKAIDIAATTERIFVLSPGTLSVLDALAPVPAFSRIEAISVGREYVEVAADGKVAALAARNGAIEIYEVNGAVLVHRAHYLSADSIIAIALVGETLCLAQGYGGVSLVDVSDPSHPRTGQTLVQPDYSQDVDLAGEFLFVLDVLNGVVVYVRTNGTYQFLDDISSDTPPTSISAHENGAAIAFGTQRCEVWNCSRRDGAQLERIVETEFPVTLIAGSRAADSVFYLASESAELAVVGGVTAQSSLPYPADEIIALENSALYSVIALDRGGNVTAFRRDPALATKVKYNGASAPSAFVAADEGLVISTPAGLQALSLTGSGIDSRIIVPGAPITTVLAHSDRFLFAGSALDGTVWSFAVERGRWTAYGEFNTGLTLRRLFVRDGVSGDLVLIAVGEEGINCYRLAADGSATGTGTLVAAERISTADLNADWLVAASETGEVNLYAFVQGELTPAGKTRCAVRPRDVIVTPEGVVVIAYAGGIQVFKFDARNGAFIEQATPAAISSAFDLSYDETLRELLVASGSTPAKYLDFSDPTRLGTVFLIAGTEGTSNIAYRHGKLYCLSADGVRVYERYEDAARNRGTDATLLSVNAAPNPFNADTQIGIELNSTVRLPLSLEVSLVNVLGQTLSRQEFVATEKSVIFDLARVVGIEPVLPSGVYFFVVRTSGEAVARKLLLLK